MKLHDILLTSLETRPLETKSNKKIWKKELDKSKKNEYNKSRWNGSLAQLVEHLTLNQGVRGSNPWWSTRHSAQSHGWLWAFLFLPNSHKIHLFCQYFYQIKKMPFRSAWRDGIFWCSVTGFIIFFVRKKYLPVIKVWRYNQSTLAAFCSLLCLKGIKGTRSNAPCAMRKGT